MECSKATANTEIAVGLIMREYGCRIANCQTTRDTTVFGRMESRMGTANASMGMVTSTKVSVWRLLNVAVVPSSVVLKREWHCAKGGYVNGHRGGYGKIVYSDKVEYEGEWRHDRYHGQGKWQHPSGDRYEGKFLFFFGA